MPRRDVALGSILTYEAVGMLLERGYALTNYQYTVNYNEGTRRKELGPIRLEFTPNADDTNMKKIYLHFDYEAMMQSAESYVKTAFGE